MVTSEFFDAFFGMVVFLNTLTMGVEYARNEDEWGGDVIVVFTIADLIFLSLFTVGAFILGGHNVRGLFYTRVLVGRTGYFGLLNC